ncbi:MAG: flippase [Candidatus Komeilibacteria bacterium]|nr:flippase [Candidatus Komeilibacteria bacterium]
MEYQASKIAKNTSYFTSALVIQKIISFVYFSYIAVKIGAGSLGSYTFALYFTTIFAVLIDVGLSNVLVREVAKFKEKSQQYLTAVMAVKVPLAILVYAAVFLTINFLDNPVLVKQLVYLAGIIMVLDSFTLTFYAFLRGHQNLKLESAGTIIFQLIVFVAGIIIVNLTDDLRFLILAILFASFFNFCYSGILLKIKLGLKFLSKVDRGIVKALLLFTVPFALAAIFTRVYGYLDTVLLNQMIDAQAVGYYSIPYKIAFSLQFIPMALVASLYPAFSSYFVQSKELLKSTFQKSLVFLGLIGVPVSLGLTALARPLMLKVYTGEYEPSILPLQILLVSLIFLFLNFPLGSLLNACNRQNRNTIHIAIVMVFNLLLNLWLIPKYSYNGAAVASSISTVLMFALQLYVARQIIGLDVKYLLAKFGAILFAGLSMYLSLSYLLNFINFILLIPIGVLIYLILVYLLKGLTKEDFFLVKASFKKSS